jgi:hypothetical protein
MMEKSEIEQFLTSLAIEKKSRPLHRIELFQP